MPELSREKYYIYDSLHWRAPSIYQKLERLGEVYLWVSRKSLNYRDTGSEKYVTQWRDVFRKVNLLQASVGDQPEFLQGSNSNFSTGFSVKFNGTQQLAATLLREIPQPFTVMMVLRVPSPNAGLGVDRRLWSTASASQTLDYSKSKLELAAGSTADTLPLSLFNNENRVLGVIFDEDSTDTYLDGILTRSGSSVGAGNLGTDLQIGKDLEVEIAELCVVAGRVTPNLFNEWSDYVNREYSTSSIPLWNTQQTFNDLYSLGSAIASWEGFADTPIAGGSVVIDGEVLGEYDFVKKLGNQTISSFDSAEWFSTNEDSHAAVIVVDGDLTINAGQTLKPANRKLFTYIHVTGTLTVEGEISMTGRGANHSVATGSGVAAADLLIYSGNAGGVTNPTIPASGAAGGAGAVNANNGTNGSVGTSGASGGGGGGAARNANGLGGSGAAGTVFSGGPGGGADYNTQTATGGGIDGGAGGDAGDVGNLTGGAGNPGGSGIGTGPDGGDGTGGTLVVYCGTLDGTGSITADGIDGGSGAGFNATGGGSGGGSVNVLYTLDKSSVTLTANGGSGGTGGAYTGGDGGAGTARKLHKTAVSWDPTNLQSVGDTYWLNPDENFSTKPLGPLLKSQGRNVRGVNFNNAGYVDLGDTTLYDDSSIAASYTFLVYADYASQANSNNYFYSEGNSGTATQFFGIATRNISGALYVALRSNSGSDTIDSGTITGLTDKAWNVITLVLDTGGWGVVVNGTAVKALGSAYTNTPSTTTYNLSTIGMLGRTSYQFGHKGPIAYGLRHDKALSLAECRQVQEYVAFQVADSGINLTIAGSEAADDNEPINDWDFVGEEGGTTLVDSEGNADGTLESGARFVVPFGIYCNGVDNYVSFGDNALYDDTSPNVAYTFLTYVDTSILTANGYLYSEGRSSSATPFVGLRISTGSQLTAFVRDDSNTLTVNKTVSVTDKAWSVVTVILEASGVGIVVNGAEALALGTSYDSAPATTTLDRATLGALGINAYSSYFKGPISYGMRHTALSLTEARQVQQYIADIAANSGITISVAGGESADPVAAKRVNEWPMNETAQGANISDTVGSVHGARVPGDVVYNCADKIRGSVFTQGTLSLQPRLMYDADVDGNVLYCDADKLLQSSEAASNWEFLHDASGVTILLVLAPGLTSNPDDDLAIFGTKGNTGSETGAYISYDDRSAFSFNDRTRSLFGTSTSVGAFVDGTNGRMPANTWQTLLVELDTNKTLTVWYNGANADSDTATENMSALGSPTHTLRLLGGVTNASSYRGRIKDIIIVKGVLTTAEKNLLLDYVQSSYGISYTEIV